MAWNWGGFRGTRPIPRSTPSSGAEQGDLQGADVGRVGEDVVGIHHLVEAVAVSDEGGRVDWPAVSIASS
jgi:hypothetical protein